MSKQKIYVILLLVVMSWGFNVTATKVLAEYFMPITMTALRIFAAGIGVFIILLILKKVRSLSKKEFLYVFMASLLNVVGHHFFLSVGLTETTASNGGLILGLSPIVTTILAVFFLHNKVNGVRILGIILGFAGVFFIVFQGEGGLSGVSLDDLYVFLAVVSQCLSFIFIKKISDSLDPRLMTGYMLVMGAAVLFILSLIMEPGGLASMKGSVSMWLLFFASAFIATSLGQMLYNYGIAKVGAQEASIFMNMTPFFSLVGASIFLGEQIVFNQIIGFLFILIGVLLGSGFLEDISRRMKEKHA